MHLEVKISTKIFMKEWICKLLKNYGSSFASLKHFKDGGGKLILERGKLKI
jgi:hypothetical protein